ncbi:MAG: helix-turn-helix domain-containing protein [Gemmiger qucibialis]
MAAAKELMAATDLKIYEVSSRVGFDSAFYFSKVFKKLEGASPPRIYPENEGIVC